MSIFSDGAAPLQGKDRSEGSSPDTPPQRVEVVVKEMPERPPKPLLKDFARLLSVAAFIFSLVTGVYATYSAWRAKTDAAVEDVGKLIALYYQSAEKIKTINAYSETAYFNLIRTQQRSQAAQAVTKALTVSNYVDVGIWMSLAQINNAELNCAASDKAWRAALSNTSDIMEYSFSLRGAAYNDWCLHKLDDAAALLETALKAVTADVVKEPRNIINYMVPQQRALEVSFIHLTWLSLFPTDCKVLVPHFDGAKAAFSEAFRDAPTTDPGVQEQMNGAAANIARFEQARAKCT